MRSNKLDIIKYLSVTGVLLLLVMFVTGCSEEPAPTTALPDASIEKANAGRTLSKDLTVPHVIFGRASRTADQTAASKTPASHEANAGGFTTPLFGLGTAPNDDILVADAGAGVARATGVTEIPPANFRHTPPYQHTPLSGGRSGAIAVSLFLVLHLLQFLPIRYL